MKKLFALLLLICGIASAQTFISPSGAARRFVRVNGVPASCAAGDVMVDISVSPAVYYNCPVATPVAFLSGIITAAKGGTGQSTYTKGDLLAAPGGATLNKVPVGTDGQVWTADSASTNGVKWMSVSSGGSAPFADDATSALVKGTSDATKLFGINVSGITTGNHPVLAITGTTTVPRFVLPAAASLQFGSNAYSYLGGVGPMFSDANVGDVIGFDFSGLSVGRIYIFPDSAGTVALTSNNLGAFANTTSLQLAAKITDETGTNKLVFSDNASLLTPAIVGHVTTSGTAPAVSSCGTSPSIAGNDSAGRVTIGSGVTTTCVLTFAATWPTAPTCFANDETSILSVQSVATTTVLTINAGSALTSNVINYRCVGY